MLFAQQQLYLIKVLMKSQFQQSKQSKQPKKAAQILLQLTPSAIASMSLETINRRLGLQDLLNKEEQQKCQWILATLQAQKGRLQNQQKMANRQNQMLNQQIQKIKDQINETTLEISRVEEDISKVAFERDQAVSRRKKAIEELTQANEKQRLANSHLDTQRNQLTTAINQRDTAIGRCELATTRLDAQKNKLKEQSNCVICFLLQIGQGFTLFKILFFSIFLSIYTFYWDVKNEQVRNNILISFGVIGFILAFMSWLWIYYRTNPYFQHSIHSA